MSCKDTIHLICWYLEGKLSSSVAQDIEAHVAHCTNCQHVLSAATTTLDQYFGISGTTTPPESSQAA